MNIGKIKPENEKFLSECKKFGFATKTELINIALDEQRKKLARLKRAKWREEAFKEYAASNVQNYFETLDAEPFKK
jgi:hypothetical protein